MPKKSPARIVYEDEWVVAFHDIHPVAPTHILVVPRRPLPNLEKAAAGDQALLGHLLLKAAEIARLAGLTNGYRLVFNTAAMLARPFPISIATSWADAPWGGRRVSARAGSVGSP